MSGRVVNREEMDERRGAYLAAWAQSIYGGRSQGRTNPVPADG
jgi:hypothetical protein